MVTSARWMMLATKVLNEFFVAAVEAEDDEDDDDEEEEEGRPIA